MSDGTIYVVGFVNADAHRRIAVDNEIHEAATLYSDYWSGAEFIVRVKLLSASGSSRFITLDDERELSAVDLTASTQKDPAGSE